MRYFPYFSAFLANDAHTLRHHFKMEGSTRMNQDKSKILVVDDNQDIRELVAHILDADGFHVFSAADGENARAILQNNRVDLILLDVMMPGTSGLELLSEIRTGPLKSHREVPVIIITAMAGTDDIDKALAIGADSYIVKPFRGALIREKVRAILELSQSEK
jgi:DNA-binding response OmpR family regulator